MTLDRRTFLKIAGLGALGTSGAISLPVLGSVESGSVGDLPSGGTRWGMVIDLAACRRDEGCRDCIEICNRVHNIPHHADARHEIKWIWKVPYPEAFPLQHHEYQEEALAEMPVPVLCNHCDNPPCVRVCPTQATWKRADGIVMMDWHRCIGCRYCMAACPYGSRSFNWVDPRQALEEQDPTFPTRTRGVVEKCTFCDERLARGELPACVTACPHGALTFGNLADPDSEVRRLLAQRHAIRRKPSLGTHPEIFYLV